MSALADLLRTLFPKPQFEPTLSPTQREVNLATDYFVAKCRVDELEAERATLIERQREYVERIEADERLFELAEQDLTGERAACRELEGRVGSLVVQRDKALGEAASLRRQLRGEHPPRPPRHVLGPFDRMEYRDEFGSVGLGLALTVAGFVALALFIGSGWAPWAVGSVALFLVAIVITRDDIFPQGPDPDSLAPNVPAWRAVFP